MLRREMCCDVIDLASHNGKQTSFMGRVWEKLAWIYQERGLRICGVLARYLRAATFAGLELWIKGEVRYLPGSRSPGEKWWHLLALACGYGGA